MVRRALIEFIGDSNIGICAFIMIWKAFGLFLITNGTDLFKRWLYGGMASEGTRAAPLETHPVSGGEVMPGQWD